MSSLLGFLNYDGFLGRKLADPESFMKAAGIDLRECLHIPVQLDTPREVFERKLCYWECRPMPNDPAVVVSPSDSKMLVGSLDETSIIFIKGKFFDLEELLWEQKRSWLRAFEGGDFAVFRLTPEKYHYNHSPVSGKVVDFYSVAGQYHACHPEAVVAMATPFSKNKRVVTIIDTDVPGGTGAGLVAMIEVVALMIGGSIARKGQIAISAASLPVASPLFIAMVVGVIMIMSALTFFPALTLGPILEHLFMLMGKTF
jgi:phosphatidylserine decarboxylase